MMHDHDQDTVMRDAMIVLAEKRDVIFIDSIIERLETLSASLDNITPDIERGLVELEYDLLVYSRMLPFKLFGVYEDLDIMEILAPVEAYDNFAELFADTYGFYVSGDIADLPPSLRRENLRGLS